MSVVLYWTLVVSLIGAVLGLMALAARHRDARLWPVAAAVGVMYSAVWYMSPAPFGARDGDSQTVAAVAICYMSMLLGMMAEYVYTQAEKEQSRLTFNPMTFVMPILASPIVFVPLLTIAGQVDAPALLSRAKLIVYLVAFQNGFFWKNFFERRRRAVVGGTRD